jgi:hypothetical protein
LHRRHPPQRLRATSQRRSVPESARQRPSPNLPPTPQVGHRCGSRRSPRCRPATAAQRMRQRGSPTARPHHWTIRRLRRQGVTHSQKSDCRY